MRRSWTAAAVTGVFALACSDRYEVGGMEMATAVAGAATSMAGTSAGGSEMVMVMKGLGGSTSSDGELGTQCVPSGMPDPLPGELAPPDVVWSRLSVVIWDELVPPPFGLPVVTTTEWADMAVSRAFDQARDERGVIPGAAAFIPKWMRYPEGDELAVTWGVALSSEAPALHALLATPWSDGERMGVFADQAWLAAYPAISTRGFLMLQALFGQFIPPEPNGLNTDVPPAPGVSRREQLAANVSNASCAACHAHIDPLGLSLEHFDGTGQYREVDAGRPVDASGTYQLFDSGRPFVFADFQDLALQLEDSCAAHLGLASEFLRLAAANYEGSPVASQVDSSEYLADRERLQQGFIRGGRSFRALVRAYAQSAAVLRP
jgi:hypothetical protein